ncbi:hypothetical protein MSSAC_1870 [Methanosarcina siciliae C2J]|uniref:GOLD domain-containing protein n=1 Tax=Methanosarcina siciliae C2J TaxID=1434118 RepID=A0A0E3PNE2_9EURY|nr:hypothetical protein [Methanosarcina siciliae]AKB36460.1 hypothetical protein MSSAC_1870 [Methanosarcina siciliae C2J]
MDGEQKDRILIVLIILVFGYSFYLSLDDEYVFGASVSDETVFEVYLTTGVTYKFLIDGGFFGGPVSLDVTISKGSYVPFDENFRTDSLDTFKVYYPYEPMFTVNENGTYQVHVNPGSSGSCKIAIFDVNS